MSEEDFANIILLVRRAPLANMDEAEAVAQLLQRYSSFVNEHIERQKQANQAREHDLENE